MDKDLFSLIGTIVACINALCNIYNILRNNTKK